MLLLTLHGAVTLGADSARDAPAADTCAPGERASAGWPRANLRYPPDGAAIELEHGAVKAPVIVEYDVESEAACGSLTSTHVQFTLFSSYSVSEQQWKSDDYAVPVLRPNEQQAVVKARYYLPPGAARAHTRTHKHSTTTRHTLHACFRI